MTWWIKVIPGVITPGITLWWMHRLEAKQRLVRCSKFTASRSQSQHVLAKVCQAACCRWTREDESYTLFDASGTVQNFDIVPLCTHRQTYRQTVTLQFPRILISFHGDGLTLVKKRVARRALAPSSRNRTDLEVHKVDTIVRWVPSAGRWVHSTMEYIRIM